MITFVRTPIQPAPRAAAPEPPRVVGVDAVRALAHYPPLLFRGEEYAVGRIGYLDGIELHRRWLEVSEFQTAPIGTADQVRAWGDAVAALIGHCYQLLEEPRPPSNPFRTATASELGAIVGFFFARLKLQDPGLSAGELQTSTS